MARLLHVRVLLLALLLAPFARADAGWYVPDGALPEGGGPCQNTDDCSLPTPYCSATLLKCVQCLADQNCGWGLTCNVARGMCVTCRTDADCNAGTPYCDQNVGSCVECRSTANCAYTGLACINGVCGSCGDGVCRSDRESAWSCPADCSYCGDYYCSGNETAQSCPQDCSYIYPEGGWDEGGTYCGDGRCSGGETYWTCPTDCYYLRPEAGAPYCGDGLCSAGETYLTCPRDCHHPVAPAPQTPEGGAADTPWDPNGSAGSAGVNASSSPEIQNAGCGCRIPVRSGSGVDPWLGALALAWLLARRRRA